MTQMYTCIAFSSEEDMQNFSKRSEFLDWVTTDFGDEVDANLMNKNTSFDVLTEKMDNFYGCVSQKGKDDPKLNVENVCCTMIASSCRSKNMDFQERPLLSDGRFLRNCTLKTSIPEQEEIGFEVLVSSPCPLPIRRYGRNELTTFIDLPKRSDEASGFRVAEMKQLAKISAAQHAESFHNTGLLFCEKPLSPKFVEAIDKEAKRRILEIEEAVRRLQTTKLLGDPADLLYFKEVSSREKGRFDMRMDCLRDREEYPILASLTIACGRPCLPWLPLIRKILDVELELHVDVENQNPDKEEDEDLLACDVSILYTIGGQCGDQTWHADGPHIGRGESHFGKNDQDSAYGVCCFVALTDNGGDDDSGACKVGVTSSYEQGDDDAGSCASSTTSAGMDSTTNPKSCTTTASHDGSFGGTEFWPGSHKEPKLLGFGAVGPSLEVTLDTCAARKGDVVMYDYRLLHRGLANTRRDGEMRRVLQLFYYRKDKYSEKRNYGRASVFDM
ncbi:unnamed protein product [Amoebophrya sp. A25]|nr:unnamed protein product [Amoebophrya sp. A25]|eukprot:GSA25T00014665001.1